MIKHINNIDINYIDYGNGDNTLVFLHGWGQNIEMMKPVGDKLKRNNRIIIVDLPGFGLSSEPSEVLSIYDYAEIINKLLVELNVKKPIILGHSFGGKIALVYACKYEINKLVVFGSPFKKDIKKDTYKTKLLKSLKKVRILNKFEDFAKKHIGSTDYKNASEQMRKILVKHVNLDISEDVSKIKCPTIIIWGSMDSAVPIDDAYKLEKLINDSAVIEYPGCSHYAYLERLGQTVSIIKNFIGDE